MDLNSNQPKKPFIKRFWWLILILFIFIAGAAFFVLGQDKNNNSKRTSSNLPKCPSNLSGVFTNQLVDTNQIAALTPLGNVNGSDHILPVDHVYFRSFPTEQNKHLGVNAPADMTITALTMHKVIDHQGNTVAHEHDYAIDAEVCSGLKVWILAINELSPTLQTTFDNGKKHHEEGDINKDEIAVNDTLNLTYKIKAGELMGYTGQKGNGSSIEISIINKNQKPNPIVDWNYYSDADRRGGIMCFADLYTGDLKNAIYQKFGDYPVMNDERIEEYKSKGLPTQAVFTPRTVEPRCGEVIQNIVGTIQGDWFYGKPKSKRENLEGEGKALTFIHKNIDPKIGIISIAGTITQKPELMEYAPTHSGTINREPSEVKADGKIYCYGLRTNDKVILQLLGDHQLKIEHQSGTCSTNEKFNKPYTYER